MSIRTIRQITRRELSNLLVGADLADLSECVYARSMSFFDGASVGQTSLAFAYSNPADFALFMVAMTNLLGGDEEALDFAGATRIDTIGGSFGELVAFWPGYVLDELSPEQEAALSHKDGAELAGVTR